jgi:hypothetical protein
MDEEENEEEEDGKKKVVEEHEEGGGQAKSGVGKFLILLCLHHPNGFPRSRLD